MGVTAATYRANYASFDKSGTVSTLLTANTYELAHLFAARACPDGFRLATVDAL